MKLKRLSNSTGYVASYSDRIPTETSVFCAGAWYDYHLCSTHMVSTHGFIHPELLASIYTRLYGTGMVRNYLSQESLMSLTDPRRFLAPSCKLRLSANSTRFSSKVIAATHLLMDIILSAEEITPEVAACIDNWVFELIEARTSLTYGYDILNAAISATTEKCPVRSYITTTLEVFIGELAVICYHFNHLKDNMTVTVDLADGAISNEKWNRDLILSLTYLMIAYGVIELPIGPIAALAQAEGVHDKLGKSECTIDEVEVFI